MDIVTLAAAKSYTDKRISESGGGDSPQATDEQIMELMTELDLVEPVTDFDGSILISNNNEIYTL